MSPAPVVSTTGNVEGGDVEKMLAVEGEDAGFAEGGGGEAAVVAALHLAEGFVRGQARR